MGLTTNAASQVGYLSQRWQARQGVAKLPIQILRGTDWEICHYWGYIISAHQIVWLLLQWQTLLVGRLNLGRCHNMNTFWCCKFQFFKIFPQISGNLQLILFPTYAIMVEKIFLLSSKDFQKWEGGLHPTLLSCLFSVKLQAAYLFQAWSTSVETIAHIP